MLKGSKFVWHYDHNDVVCLEWSVSDKTHQRSLRVNSYLFCSFDLEFYGRYNFDIDMISAQIFCCFDDKIAPYSTSNIRRC